MSVCMFVVKGEEDKTITAGSLVTVTVELRREPLIDVSFGENDIADDVEEDQEDKLPDDLAGSEAATQALPHYLVISGF